MMGAALAGAVLARLTSGAARMRAASAAHAREGARCEVGAAASASARLPLPLPSSSWCGAPPTMRARRRWARTASQLRCRHEVQVAAAAAP